MCMHKYKSGMLGSKRLSLSVRSSLSSDHADQDRDESCALLRIVYMYCSSWSARPAPDFLAASSLLVARPLERDRVP